MKIVEKDINEIFEYENNPRNNDAAIEAVANSIKEFGFKVPVIVDKDNVIVAGHTRIRAAEMLGLTKIPCIVADDLNEEQIKAFRLVDNKTAELATWDFEKLNMEIEDIENIDLSNFGFDEEQDVKWDEVPELDEESYEEPSKERLECPKCHHIAGKEFFKKVKE